MVKKLIFDLTKISDNYFPGKYGSSKEIELRLGKFVKPINMSKLNLNKINLLKRTAIPLSKNYKKKKY